MPDYDMVVVGSGFAGSAAALSFLETAEKAGRAGRVAVIEAGENGTRPGASRSAGDNELLPGRTERSNDDGDYWRRLAEEAPNTVEFMKGQGAKLLHHDE